ncbi:hypothetical protein EA658_09935 [Pseudoxanthomonas winnipegensis]|uniref:Uncharacterized protein n=1 Tax=Pseudoxanthomonas winnipegensis TaxID=2480810 RepID=A0ABY1WCS6_9GAMM|nr:hypothetical protein [Pseudoxanthomonas winnipegensis]TAA12448.1 hypothetical protein EA659_03715 [Pseudoxanthomonas winnipegensis]TAA19187.1 hypothetical protein EA658_09935 [Pseudoxanthomonas winnipegensis]TAH70448.1 hypothetical protein EA657_17000 [Pseudoxanthomonas winnipegensis]
MSDQPTPISIEQLVSTIGSENISVQNLNQALDGHQQSVAGRARLTFMTKVPLLELTESNTTTGLILWIKTAKVKEAIAAITAGDAGAGGRVLTCVYCGMQYPQGTPAAGDQVLTDHIRVCEKHPLRDAEAKVARLRAALYGLLGLDGPERLADMAVIVRAMPGEASDIEATLEAIRALQSLEVAHG